MKKPLITISSDFGIQTQGIGIMEAVALDICPDANVVHLMHGLPDFDTITAARTMETISTMPVGYHVCVVDPGVGTKRKGIIIKTKRGDYFIGPDNGIFTSAVNKLGGCVKVVAIENKKYMRQPVSPIFHGRDVFAPAAAHLANGVEIEKFGKELDFDKLVPAPYEEAIIKNTQIHAEVIHVNKFGSVHFNIDPKLLDEFGAKKKDILTLSFDSGMIEVPYVTTFGDVDVGQPLLFKDDYIRVEAAINMGSFVEKYKIKRGDKFIIRKIKH